MHIAEIMTPDPIVVGPDCPLDDAIHLFEQCGFRHLPVVEDGALIGMVSDRDLSLATGWVLADYRRTEDSDGPQAVREIMRSPVLSLSTLDTPEDVAAMIVGKRIGDYREDVTDLLQWVGLGHRMHAYPSVLSGGEKQRAAIARAVIGKPELLLADEPTGNVDPQMARRLLRLFIELNRLGTSVLIATHDHQLMRQFKAPRLELHEGHVRIV